MWMRARLMRERERGSLRTLHIGPSLRAKFEELDVSLFSAPPRLLPLLIFFTVPIK
jgi:hypothetical protein